MVTASFIFINFYAHRIVPLAGFAVSILAPAKVNGFHVKRKKTEPWQKPIILWWYDRI